MQPLQFSLFNVFLVKSFFFLIFITLGHSIMMANQNRLFITKTPTLKENQKQKENDPRYNQRNRGRKEE